MIETEILRVLYVDTKDILPNVFEKGLSKLNCKKEDLKYVSYDFFDNTAVGILTNKQIVYVQAYKDKLDTKVIKYYDISNVGYEMIEDRLKISLRDKHHNLICNLPTSTFANSVDIVKTIYTLTMQSKNKPILQIIRK